MNRQSEIIAKATPSSLNTHDSGNGESKTEKSRQCPICHVFYKYGNSYWQHVRYVHARVLSQCVICEKSYKRTTMVKHHILHSHKIAWHLCSNYVRKIKKSDMKEKRDIKNSVEKKILNLKYYKKKTLNLISSFNCYYCPGSFSTISELFQHVKTHRYDSRRVESDSDYEKADSHSDKVDSHMEEVDSSHEILNFNSENVVSSYEPNDIDYD